MDSDGNSPLLIACENENEKIIKYLIENGSNINHMDGNSNSLLLILYENENEKKNYQIFN